MKPSSCINFIGLLLPMLWMSPAAASPADTARLSISLLSPSTAGAVTIGITSATNTNIRLDYQLLRNGLPGPKGVLTGLYLTHNHLSRVRLPVKLPTGDEETWLRIICRRPGAPRNAAPIATALLPLRPWRGDRSIPPTGELTFTDSNGIFTITAPNTQIEFDKQTGWLLHYEAGQTLLMGDTAGLQPTLWPGIQPRLQLFSTSTGTQLVIVRAEYTVPETWSLLHMSYTINATGEMLIGEMLEADTSQHLPDSVHRPPVPRFGMHWLLPAGLDTITWLGSADTTTAPAISRGPLTSPVADTRETNYPNIRWLTVTGSRPSGLRIIADSNLLRLQISPAPVGISGTVLDIDGPPSPPSNNIQCFFKVMPEIPPPPAAHKPAARRP